jgi:phosphoglycerate dehydrogenase-like enzyme
MKKYTCLVLTRDCDEFEKKLQKCNLPNLNIIIGRNKEIIKKYLPKVDIIFGDPPTIKNYISQASSLKWVQSNFAGIDALIGENLPKNYTLTNVKNTYGKPMAEYVFAYILGLKRKIFSNQEWQSQHHWNQFEYKIIENESIGIIGTGSIGKEIARIAKAFGMKTRGMNTQGDGVKFFDKTFSRQEQEQFFSGLDYIVSVLPNTSKTKHFFNSKTFSQMESSSWFISIGRGQNVCETSLIKALDTKQIAGAILDVFEIEPLPKNSPLWDMGNVYITPHVSGHVITDIAFEIFTKNYQKFRNGDELDYKINFNKGY